MSIVFDENLDLFCLETANTSYIIGLADHRYLCRSCILWQACAQAGSALSASVPERHRCSI